MISTELLNQLQQLTASANLTPAVESAIHNLMESAYEEGYSDGVDEGRLCKFYELSWGMNMLKKLTLKEQYNHHLEYTNDIDRIVKIFADRGYEISHTDACRAWENYSDCMSAGWMSLGSDDEVFMDAFGYFEEM